MCVLIWIIGYDTFSGLSPISNPYSSWTWGKRPPLSSPSPSTHRIAPLLVTTLLWPHNSLVLHVRLSRFETPHSLELLHSRVAQQARVAPKPRHQSRERASHRTGPRTTPQTQWYCQPVFWLYDGVFAVGAAGGAVASRLDHLQIPVGRLIRRSTCYPWSCTIRYGFCLFVAVARTTPTNRRIKRLQPPSSAQSSQPFFHLFVFESEYKVGVVHFRPMTSTVTIP